MSAERSKVAGSMTGKTVVMTGGTSGLGLPAARALAGLGARLLLVARDRDRGEAALASLPSSGVQQQHALYLADMACLADVKRVGNEIVGAESAVHALINNAGSMFNSRQVTEEGLERTFMVNHLSCFVLTLGLKDRLAATGGARVVNTASFGHRGQAYDRTDLQFTRSYSSSSAYSRSKLYNVLFTRELARRWKALGITVNCFSPGMVATNFGSGELGRLEPVLRLVVKLLGKSPEQGSQNLVYLASSGEVSSISGEYFAKCRIEVPSVEARNDESAADLWQQSLALAGMTE